MVPDNAATDAAQLLCAFRPPRNSLACFIESKDFTTGEVTRVAETKGKNIAAYVSIIDRREKQIATKEELTLSVPDGGSSKSKRWKIENATSCIQFVRAKTRTMKSGRGS
jgi:hypothetical protein